MKYLYQLLIINRSFEQIALDIIEDNNLSSSKEKIGELFNNLYQKNKHSMPNLIQLEDKFKELKTNKYNDLRYFLIDAKNKNARPYREFWEAIVNSDKLLVNFIKKILLIFLGFLVPFLELIDKTKNSDSGWLMGLISNQRLALFLVLYLIIWVFIISPLFDRYKCVNAYIDLTKNKKTILFTAIFSVIFFLVIFILPNFTATVIGIPLYAILKILAIYSLVGSYLFINKSGNLYILNQLESWTGL